ncbi:hypothetical protein SynPROS71_01159 [Synechococcus sp. PROS-7-1]|nr:hypothetical protein SynPROS71_01159 [Synechococcus sp. PROS-7-1]
MPVFEGVPWPAPSLCRITALMGSMLASILLISAGVSGRCCHLVLSC